MGEIRQHLQERYKINDPRVYDYLFYNRGIEDLLIEGYDYIIKCFGDNTQVELVIDRDPEFGEHGLWGYIQTDMSVDASMEALDCLARDWYLDAVTKAVGAFNFDVRYT